MYVAPEMSREEMEGMCRDLQDYTAARRTLSRALTELLNQSHDLHSPQVCYSLLTPPLPICIEPGGTIHAATALIQIFACVVCRFVHGW